MTASIGRGSSTAASYAAGVVINVAVTVAIAASVAASAAVSLAVAWPAPAVAAVPSTGAEAEDAFQRYRAGSGLTGAARLDPPAAMASLTKAAELGHPQAQVTLAFAYLNGSPALLKDRAAALRWFEAASRAGVVRADCLLGDLYREGGIGQKADAQRAARHYRRGAASSDPCAPAAQYGLYRLFSAENGDLPTALRWLRLSAEAGNPVAQRALGERYRDGKGLTRDPVLAKEWLKKSREGVSPHDDEDDDHEHRH
ncbi:MAG: sel1 repeat family protein [Rubrivivax sp.]|nr:MAG: sel1 repeat family protein [Rubrivivax sp.]